ncbi:MAG: glycosyltransferase family 2 protein [Planctomycetota bacterium]|nr:glycosyltransferase family 2 protein [Planctomycetota bacterium]
MTPAAITMLALLITACVMALLALVMALVNMKVWPLPAAPEAHTPTSPLLSICIPARNEERNIEAIIQSLLAQSHTNLEVLVYDDQSTDGTGSIIARLAAADARIKLVPSIPLPSGWNGKQHACWRMSQHAKGEYLLFTDADVRFESDCLARTLATAKAMNAPLLSGFPHQETHSASEALIVPMIFFILLSYLPFARMRATNDPSTSAGCGQFLFARRDAYDASGGHEGFKNSMHDGIRLPRAVRRAGFHSDLFDCTSLCSVRMYFGLRSTWAGFAKNAYEGLGNPVLLIVLTCIHLIAHVFPWLYLATIPLREATPTSHLILALLAILFALTQRAAIHARLDLPHWPVVLHPLAILLMTLIQWHSFVLHMTGKRSWRGRTT